MSLKFSHEHKQMTVLLPLRIAHERVASAAEGGGIVVRQAGHPRSSRGELAARIGWGEQREPEEYGTVRRHDIGLPGSAMRGMEGIDGVEVGSECRI